MQTSIPFNSFLSHLELARKAARMKKKKKAENLQDLEEKQIEKILNQRKVLNKTLGKILAHMQDKKKKN